MPQFPTTKAMPSEALDSRPCMASAIPVESYDGEACTSEAHAVASQHEVRMAEQQAAGEAKLQQQQRQQQQDLKKDQRRGASSKATCISCVDYDARYRKGWAYGKAPNEFFAAVVAEHWPRPHAPPLAILSLGEGQGRNAVHLASLGHECTAVDRSSVGLAKAMGFASEAGVRSFVRTVHADLSEAAFDPSTLRCAGRGSSAAGRRKESSRERLDEGGEDGRSCGDEEASGECWDGMVSIFCSLPPDNRRSVHRKCAAALKPGGLVIVECFAPRHAEAAAAAAEAAASFGSPRLEPSCGGKSSADHGGGHGGGHGGNHSGEGNGFPMARGKTWARSGPTDPSELVSTSDLREDFAGFEVIVCREVHRRLEEGNFHRGGAVLTQFVARKPLKPSSGAQHEPDRMLSISSQSSSLLPPSFPSHRESMDAVFDEAAAAVHAAETSLLPSADAPLEYAAAAVEEARKAAATTASTDRLLSVARASVHIACRAAERDGICRYCWVERRACLCSEITALANAQRSAPIETSIDTLPNDAPTMVHRPAAAYPTYSPQLHVHWVFLTHPNEFMRATSTAKIAAQLLGGGGGVGRLTHTSELLVFGAECHAARIHSALRTLQTGTGKLFFPIPRGERGQSVAEAMEEACRRHQLMNRGGEPNGQRGQYQQLEHSKEQDNGAGNGVEASPSITLLVPDGSWECARALVRETCSRVRTNPHTCDGDCGERGGIGIDESGDSGAIGSSHGNRALFVELNAARAAAHSSALLDALHAGSGRGRLSTLEACVMCLEEMGGLSLVGGQGGGDGGEGGKGGRGGNGGDGGEEPSSSAPCERLPQRAEARAAECAHLETVRSGMRPLLEHVRGLTHGENSASRSASGALLAAWASALQTAAGSAQRTHPLGLRRCAVCAAALATPLHMKTHIAGRRHCEAVAMRHLAAVAETHTSQPDAPATAEKPCSESEAAAVFDLHSSAVLWETLAEPPDVALAAVHQALSP